MSDTLRSTPSGSRRKRRGTGPIAPSAPEAPAASAEASTSAPAEPARPRAKDLAAAVAQPASKVLSIGRFEREDFERVEGLVITLVTRNQQLQAAAQQLSRGFFAPASAEERQKRELQAAFYSFLMYGYRDGNGVRIIDLFRRAGPALTGRQLAAQEACEQARLVLVAVEDVNPSKQRIRGRDLLRAEPIALRDRNASNALRPGDRILCWVIPWGTSWQPVGVATHVEARKADALERAIESMANAFRAVRRELPERHPADLFWVVYRVAGMS